MLLAIDTSTYLTGLALHDGTAIIAAADWYSGRDHSAQLLPQLDMLLRHSRRNRAEITAVGVALGPGSWSGLRVGLSIAKALVLAADVALLGIGTLDILARGQANSALPIYPLIALGRDRFATARFSGGPQPQRCEADRNLSLGELAALIDAPACLCGELDAPNRERLRAALGERAIFPPADQNLRRSSCLAELAWQRFAAGERDNPTTLEPIYLGEAVRPKLAPNS